MSGPSTGVPSGRTISSGPSTETTGPVYTITDPSGDQTGLLAVPLTSRWGSPPSSGILKSPAPLLSAPAAAIHLPSGDQLAAPFMSIAEARGRMSPPSAVSVFNV